jgi:nucleoside-diphosphate-sugar epimerase
VSEPEATVRSVLIVGAAGEIGGEVSERLPHLLGDGWAIHGADLRPDDSRGIEALDVTDLDAYVRACTGVDTVVHLAGERDDTATWEQLQGPNVIGAYHAFEAASRARCRRVVFASSVHAVLGHPPDSALGPGTPPRPANLYGATKLWGESLARLSSDAHGVSCLCLRIGWAGAADDRRKLRIPAARDLYLTYGDAARLVAACVTAPDDVHFALLNAASANSGSRFPVDDTRRIVGYEPQDDAQALWARLQDEVSGPRS